MKTATLPPVRITPKLRQELESVLQSNESVSAFVQAAVEQQIRQRQTDSDFVARAWQTSTALRAGCPYTQPEDLMRDLRLQLSRLRSQP